jgi:predicted peroxiredoxin
MIGCSGGTDTPGSIEAASSEPTVVMSITSGIADPHPVTMALQLAGHALADGREVVLFFNVKGVEIPSNALPDDLAFHADPISTLLRNLIDQGVTAIACPHCLEALGIGEEELLPGVTLATRETLFGSIHENTVVFTY